MNWLERLLHEWRQHKINMLNIKNEHELEMSHCASCEILKAQLEAQNQIIRELTKPLEEVGEIRKSAPQPITNHIPWRVRRAQIESADKKRAAELKEQREREITADNLEAELKEVQENAG